MQFRDCIDCNFVYHIYIGMPFNRFYSLFKYIPSTPTNIHHILGYNYTMSCINGKKRNLHLNFFNNSKK